MRHALATALILSTSLTGLAGCAEAEALQTLVEAGDPIACEPVLLATFDGSHDIKVVRDGIAYGLSERGLEIWDVSTPGERTWLGGHSLGIAGVDIGLLEDQDVIVIPTWKIGKANAPLQTAWTPPENMGEEPDVGLAPDPGLFMEDGLVVIDVSDPEAPVQLAAYPELPENYLVHVDGDLAYVTADPYDGTSFYIVDLSTPADPPAPELVNTAGTTNGTGLEIVDGIAWTSNEGGIENLDISDPMNLSSPNITTTMTGVSCWDLTVFDGIQAIFACSEKVYTVDITNPAVPRISGTFEGSDNPSSVVIEGELAYVNSGDYLEVLDLGACR